jgi:hypothetical protein
MQKVNIQSVPSQQLQAALNGQNCVIAIYVKNQCMFFDLSVGGTQIAYAVQCKNLVSLVPTSYLGFKGWLVIYDTQGISDPIYTGLGTRWVLLYLEQEDLATYGLS